MTTVPSPHRRPRLSTRTLSVRMIAASFAAAGAIFGGLAVQMANGHDPALGAGTTSTHRNSSTVQTNSSSTQASSSSAQTSQSGGSASGVVTRAS